MLRHALIPVLALTLGSCAKGGPLDDLGLDRFMPRVRFQRLAVKDVSFRQIDTAFVLAVDNPNPVGVKLASFTWDLALDGKPFVGGREDGGLALEARGSSKVRVPVSVVFSELVDLVGVGAGQDTVPFRFSGEMGFRTPLGVVQVPWRAKGAFPVLRAPKVSFERLRLDRIDLLKGSATLALDLGLTHAQASALTFAGFDYDLELGGRRIVGGQVERLATVAPGEREVVSLPITVNLLAVGGTIADAIRGGGKVDVGLDATVQVGTPFGPVPLTIDERGLLRVER